VHPEYVIAGFKKSPAEARSLQRRDRHLPADCANLDLCQAFQRRQRAEDR